MKKLTKKDLELLNSKKAIKKIIRSDKVDIESILNELKYEVKLEELHSQMIKFQSDVIRYKKKVVIIIEGRDAAGKGGAIQEITSHINPRHFRTVALPKPNEDQAKQWYFQRYVNELPKPGEIVFFDRSWYNRAVVEPVNGFCTKKDHEIFMKQVNDFEKMIIDSKTTLLKLYFTVSKDEQKRRFKKINESELLRWRMTSVDEKAQDLWDKYSEYEQKMLYLTNSKHAPWTVIDSDYDLTARIQAMEMILS